MAAKKISTSPDRFRFYLERYLERQAAQGHTPDNNDDVRAMVESLESNIAQHHDPDRFLGREHNNLEYDLVTTPWILARVRESDTYAQNLYAAMCNRDFQRNQVWPTLRGETWSCSWRYAGGIIADMRGSGDYIDWYCSGMGDGLGNGDADGTKGYVGEGVVTDEIRQDLLRLGWCVLDDDCE